MHTPVSVGTHGRGRNFTKSAGRAENVVDLNMEDAREAKMAAVDAEIERLSALLDVTTDEAARDRIADRLINLAFNPEGLKYRRGAEGFLVIDEGEHV